MNHLYVVATWVPRKETITVGSLGSVTFARHKRADKPLRWHADYLFSRHPAARSWLIDTDRTECEVAMQLRRVVPGIEHLERTAELRPPLAGTAVAGFGASDCGCRGHLVSARRWRDLDWAIGGATGRGGCR